MINSSLAQAESLALNNSAADTFMIGIGQLYIEEQYDYRRVTIEGYGGSFHAIRNMKIETDIKAVAIDNLTILVRVSEAVISPYKTIISAYQVRPWGHVVDDVPRKYGGRQAIFLAHSNLNIPLK